MENLENHNELPDGLASRLKNYVALMPDVLRSKYEQAIINANIEVLMELSEKIDNRIAYEQEKSDDRCASLKETQSMLMSWLDFMTK